MHDRWPQELGGCDAFGHGPVVSTLVHPSHEDIDRLRVVTVGEALIEVESETSRASTVPFCALEVAQYSPSAEYGGKSLAFV